MPSVDPNPWFWLPGALVGLGVLCALALAGFVVLCLTAWTFDLLTNPPEWWRRWREK